MMRNQKHGWGVHYELSHIEIIIYHQHISSAFSIICSSNRVALIGRENDIRCTFEDAIMVKTPIYNACIYRVMRTDKEK